MFRRRVKPTLTEKITTTTTTTSNLDINALKPGLTVSPRLKDRRFLDIDGKRHSASVTDEKRNYLIVFSVKGIPGLCLLAYHPLFVWSPAFSTF